MDDTPPEKHRETPYMPWKPELWALGGSCLSLAGMVVLLAVFNNKPVFDVYGVTLNAAVSVLSAAFKSALIYTISECVSQWKWILFSRDELPLIDFERLDSASRGPLGGINVLCKTRGSRIVRIGALLTLLAVAMDPFSQQLVQLRQGTKFVQELNNARAESPRTKQYNKGEYTIGNCTNSTINPSGPPVCKAAGSAELSMEASIFNGFTRSLAEIRQQANVKCPTGRCTWPTFQTLGVCYKCHNLTSELKRIDGFGLVAGSLFLGSDIMGTNDSTAFALPNGHFMAGINEFIVDSLGITRQTYQNSNRSWFLPTPSMTAFGTGDPQKTNRMQQINTLIWSTSVINVDTDKLGARGNDKSSHQSRWPNVPMSAVECAAYYCVQNIDTTVEGNTVSETTTADPNVERAPDSWQPDIGHRGYAPENIPPDDRMSNLEWDELYSVVKREDLILYHPLNSSGTNYTLGEAAVKTIGSYFAKLLTGNITGEPSVTAAIAERLGQRAVGYNGAWADRIAYPNGFRYIYQPSTPFDLSGWFAACTASLTNEMRRNGGPPAASGDGPASPSHADFEELDKPVYGLIGVATTYYSVEWGWMALHGVMLLGGLLFCQLTIRNSSSPELVRIWKSSSLAVMRQGRETGHVLKESKTIEELRNRAKDQHL
ncbi:hypothetical protein NLG97_g2532 [Lecanicillium saksenae]|uniref:Uncharacterized protein n=1 Tax=Lecanicillium saksenae TaxID=468837 RepID=A0ACC1R1X3_9HYPO|nr:hypothetical protein NLG97_g2532 [Lecanicillium saksenae]